MKERKMKWPLISNRSSQQETRQSEKSQPIPGGETPQEHLNYLRATTSAALNTALFPIPILILCISAIGLTIAKTFGCLFGLMLYGFGGLMLKITYSIVDNLSMRFKTTRDSMTDANDQLKQYQNEISQSLDSTTIKQILQQERKWLDCIDQINDEFSRAKYEIKLHELQSSLPVEATAN